MHIITRKRLNDFALQYPEVKTALQHWYQVVKTHNFNSFNELKTLFPHADQVGKLTVFNIAGNKVRLIAAIHYNSHKIYIRQILTHSEYDKNKVQHDIETLTGIKYTSVIELRTWARLNL